MKKLQHFCATVILTFAFHHSGSGGEISTPGVTSPPQQQSSATGEIGFPDSPASSDIQAPGESVLDPVTEAALSLLQSVLSLF